MSAIDTPKADAPAEEWGAFAVSIPGWKEPNGDRFFEALMPYIAVGSPIFDLYSPRFVIDPDHWAWEGWLRRMLGNHQDSIMVLPNTQGLVEWHNGNDWDAQSLPMGRACIAAAAALGRWPGGGE